MAETNTTTNRSEFKSTSENVINKIKELINEGNARRIIIFDKEGKILAEFPLTMGVLGVALAPVFAAIGVIIALGAECTIVVERDGDQ